MKLSDNFNLSDSLGMQGFVVIKDNKTGKILVQKKNMILKAGKRALLSRFLYNIENKIQTDSKFIDIPNMDNLLAAYKGYHLSHYCFFENLENEVSYTENNGNYSIDETKGLIEALSNTNTSLEEDVVTGHITLTVTGTIDISKAIHDTVEKITISSLGLLMKNDTEIRPSTLFSRITFDPITLTKDSSLTLIYYVYF